jgi:radical SAM superfamily enzyme YgiQ (UPF0313 family)
MDFLKMKLALINISLRPDAARRLLPVGLAYIATALKNAHIEFDIIDMDINKYGYDDLRNTFSQKQYDVFAFGCIVSGFKIMKEIASIARGSNKEALIIAGNSVADAVPELTLMNSEVDVCISGEGDFTIIKLLKANNISEVKGVFYLKDAKMLFTGKREVSKDLDVYGFPDWDIFDLNKYKQYSKVNMNYFGVDDEALMFPLTTARGCPYNCTFCYISVRDENIRYRRYSEEAISNEIKRLHHSYGASYISFWDDFSFPNKKSVKERIKTLEKLDFRIGWDAPVRSGLFEQDDISLLKELKNLGCDNLSFSLENADPEILKAIDKRIDVKGFIEQCHVMHEAGVTPLTSVIFGYPQETVDSIKATIDVCEEAGVFPSVGFLLPLPGTQIYEWAKQHGKIKDDYEFLMNVGDRQDFHINLTELPTDVLVGEVTERLTNLAKKQGLELESVFKTVTYKKPKK